MTFDDVKIYVVEEYLCNAQDIVKILIDLLDHVEYLQFIVVPRMGKSKQGVQKIENSKNDQWYVHFYSPNIDIIINTRAFLAFVAKSQILL